MSLLWRKLWEWVEKSCHCSLVSHPWGAGKGRQAHTHSLLLTFQIHFLLLLFLWAEILKYLSRCLHWTKVTCCSEHITVLKFSQFFSKASLNGSYFHLGGSVKHWGIQGSVEHLDIALYLIFMEFVFMERLHRNRTITEDLLMRHVQWWDSKHSCS